MFEYEGGVEIESEGGDNVQLDGNRREDAGCRVGPRDRRNLHVFLLECLVRHFLKSCWLMLLKGFCFPPIRQYLNSPGQVFFCLKTTESIVIDTKSH